MPSFWDDSGKQPTYANSLLSYHRSKIHILLPVCYAAIKSEKIISYRKKCENEWHFETLVYITPAITKKLTLWSETSYVLHDNLLSCLVKKQKQFNKMEMYVIMTVFWLDMYGYTSTANPGLFNHSPPYSTWRICAIQHCLTVTILQHQLDKRMLHWQPATCCIFQLFIIICYLANKVQLSSHGRGMRSTECRSS